MSNPIAKPFFAFKASASGDTLHIFGDIGPMGVHDVAFRKQLDAVKASSLTVEINSLGGDVFTGVAVFNMLKGSGKTVDVKVMGVAASAASVIAMAGNTIEMPEGTFLMIHRASAGARGNADQLRKTAELLDKVGGEITAIYANRTGTSADKIEKLLAAETWLTADEALNLGFATKIGPAIEARAQTSALAALPAHVAAQLKSRGAPLARPHAVSVADEIRALCNVAKCPQAAAGFIAAGKTLAEVRTALLEPTKSVSTASIWNTHHQQQGKK